MGTHIAINLGGKLCSQRCGGAHTDYSSPTGDMTTMSKCGRLSKTTQTQTHTHAWGKLFTSANIPVADSQIKEDDLLDYFLS